MNPTLEDFKRDSWRVHPELKMPEGLPPGVMFTLLDFDPRSKYSETLKRWSEAEVMLQESITPPMTPPLLHETMLIAAWDTVFHEVPGDRVFLVFNGNGSQSGSGVDKTGPITSILISSNERVESKWFVTRATWFEGKAVCWCLQIRLKQGQQTDVHLTQQNMLTLDLN